MKVLTPREVEKEVNRWVREVHKRYSGKDEKIIAHSGSADIWADEYHRLYRKYKKLVSKRNEGLTFSDEMVCSNCMGAGVLINGKTCTECEGKGTVNRSDI